MVGLCGQAYASIAVNSTGPLLRGEPTRRSTGHTRGSPSAAGRISAAWSPSMSFSSAVRPMDAHRSAREGQLSDVERQAPGAAFFRRSGRSGSGFHPAMMRAHSSAWTLLSMPGDRSIAADSSAGEVVVGRPAHVLVLAE